MSLLAAAQMQGIQLPVTRPASVEELYCRAEKMKLQKQGNCFAFPGNYIMQ